MKCINILPTLTHKTQNKIVTTLEFQKEACKFFYFYYGYRMKLKFTKILIKY